MDPITIIALVAKGLSIMETVWENRELLMGAFQSVKNIIDNHDTISEDELLRIESDLDALLDEFNRPMPP